MIDVRSASDIADSIAAQTEKSLLGQLNFMISRGIIVAEYGPPRFFRAYDSNEVTYQQTVELKLKDQEYIKELEAKVEHLEARLTLISDAIGNVIK